MPDMTLFDVTELSGPEPTRPLRQAPTPAPPPAPAAPGGLAEPPEVEVRVSARRKKTSEARWEGGRIVVSLPAHLDAESRQKTIDWLVNRLLTRERGSRPTTGAPGAGDRPERSLPGRRAAGVRALGDKPDGALGFMLVLLG